MSGIKRRYNGRIHGLPAGCIMQRNDHERFEQERPLRVLHVEDSSQDQELVAEALRSEGLKCEIICVSTEREFQNALDGSAFDLILSDFTLPSFDGARA